MLIRIEASDLPGRDCGQAPGFPMVLAVTRPARRALRRAVGTPIPATLAEAADCGTCPSEFGASAAVPSAAADGCCGLVNFFTSTAAADAWNSNHPAVTGQALGQREAWEIGVHIFGPLLQPGL